MNHIKKLHQTGLYFSLILAVLALTSCSATKNTPGFVANSYKATDYSSMQADSLGGYVFFPDTRVLVRSTFTSDSLMTEIRTADTLSLYSMVGNGVTFWIDPSGKKTEKFGVAYPAARSEMMKRQADFQRENQNDTVKRYMRFSLSDLVGFISNRSAALTDKKGTRFVDNDVAKVYLDTNGELVYEIKFAFSQLDTVPTGETRISIGVDSQIHQAVIASSQGGGIATRPNITDRERRTQQQRPQQRPMRMNQIPVNGWVLFVVNAEPLKMSTPTAPESKEDDIYYRPDNK
jgi:hypothetical protein